MNPAFNPYGKASLPIGVNPQISYIQQRPYGPKIILEPLSRLTLWCQTPGDDYKGPELTRIDVTQIISLPYL